MEIEDYIKEGERKPDEGWRLKITSRKERENRMKDGEREKSPQMIRVVPANVPRFDLLTAPQECPECVHDEKQGQGQQRHAEEECSGWEIIQRNMRE
jgi:hypothetical protein